MKLQKRKYVDYVEIGWIYLLMLPLPSLFAKTPGLSFVSPSPTMTLSVYDKDYTGMSDHIHFYSPTIIVMLYSPGTFLCVCPLLLWSWRCYRECNVSVMRVRINKWSCIIFGTNQKQRRLVRKELGFHDDTFAAVQLQAGEFLTHLPTSTQLC